MQFCNEQTRTQPLFSPAFASTTYGSAQMYRQKNCLILTQYKPIFGRISAHHGISIRIIIFREVAQFLLWQIFFLHMSHIDKILINIHVFSVVWNISISWDHFFMGLRWLRNYLSTTWHNFTPTGRRGKWYKRKIFYIWFSHFAGTQMHRW